MAIGAREPFFPPSHAAGGSIREIATPVEPELDPPLQIVEPRRLLSPLVLSSPHSGSIYPANFLSASRLSPLALRRSEDAHVDDLFAGAVHVGAPLLKALFPRAYLDVNREPYELDPRMFAGRLPTYANTRSIRVAGGLGTIARVVAEAQEIYAERMPVEEALLRIETLYKPYHRALRDLVARAARLHGMAVLIDCHSMPSASASGPAGRRDERMRADIVLGDRYGTSCEPSLVDCMEASLRSLGYKVQRNKPYAGGFITEYFGSASRTCDAIQIELNRALYMDEATLEKSARFEAVAGDMSKMLADMDVHARAMAARRQGAAAAE